MRAEFIREADFYGSHMPNNEDSSEAIKAVTDGNKEQDSLRSAIERFSKAFQLGPHMMTIIREPDYRYVDVNLRFLETKGFNREDVIGKTPIEIGVPENEFREQIEILEAQGAVQNYEGSLIMKNGSTGTVIVSAEKIQMDNQRCILFAYNDITEMKRMQMDKVIQLSKNLKLEEDLSRSNQLIADSINNIQDGFYVLDNQWNLTYVNKRAEELFLKTREELIGKVFWQVLPQARGTLFEVNLQDAKKVGLPTIFESLGLIHQDTWFEVTAYPSQFGMSVYYRDITDRKLSRKKLIKSQKETALILASMTDCFFALDKNLQFTHINRAAEIAFGKSGNAWLGKKITEVCRPDAIALQHYQEVINERKPVSFEILSEVLGNKWLEINAYPIDSGMSCYFRDITDRKIADKEFARLESLNLVGQLAAVIGHEIRNPMTTVRGYLQLLGARPVNVALTPTFDLMISELDRANSIITKFLSLTQTKETKPKVQDLNDIISNLYPLIEADTFTRNKQISFTPGKIPNLVLDEKGITQLVLNLTRNGLEAMHRNGCLRVNSYVEEDRVVLAIEDEGDGIPTENMSKIGTPFFTTKDNGTGLGLATCYKIAAAHNAKIRFDSSSRGTTVFICFPIPEIIA